MEADPTRMLELLVDLPAVTVLGVADLMPSAPQVLHIETRLLRAPGCPDCARPAALKERRRVQLADLPVFGRRSRMVWHKRRWRCAHRDCERGSWTSDRPADRRGQARADRPGRTVGDLPGRQTQPVPSARSPATFAATGTRSTTR